MLFSLAVGTADAYLCAPGRKKSPDFWPFYDGRILVETKSGHPAQKTSFVVIYGGVALPSDAIFTGSGDGRCISVCIVVDKVSVFLAVLRWAHFS